MTAILVTGGTGTLGRALVPELRAAGHTVRTLSRHPPPQSAEPGTWAVGDLRHGVGIGQAVAGMQVIVHCASASRGDEEAARHLVSAAHAAGVGHVVFISIVGVDRVPLGYYRAKLAAERVITGSGLGWTILRSTQYHELILRGCELLARPPVMLVPAGISFQPVATQEVASRLAALAAGPPSGRVANIGGPQIRDAAGLAAHYLHAAGRHRPIVAVRLPGRVFAACRAGGHLAPDQATGTITFEDILTARHHAGEGQ